MSQTRGKSTAPAQATQTNSVGAAQMKVTSPRHTTDSSKSVSDSSSAQPAQMFLAGFPEKLP